MTTNYGTSSLNDEVHFYLNAMVIIHDCRILVLENPRAFHTSTLHSPGVGSLPILSMNHSSKKMTILALYASSTPRGKYPEESTFSFSRLNSFSLLTEPRDLKLVGHGYESLFGKVSPCGIIGAVTCQILLSLKEFSGKFYGSLKRDWDIF
ncbi:hypothetical protein TNIN_367921 [Trichonephila inaurata madagascariensis]|uniref:Uncharacterized protein n=1 Tax=Trichonephila inaurata madagascariensis TaxID=2747483 RepID=A0A8X7BXE1_9ARAC|nr:hypothetical protein TNIN_367921 [Trichonephila inaurata madagascariensis]